MNHRVLLVVAVALLPACKGKLHGEIAMGGGSLEGLEVRVVPQKDIAAWLTPRAGELKAQRDAVLKAAQDASTATDRFAGTYQAASAKGKGGDVEVDGVKVKADAMSERSGWYTAEYDAAKHDEGAAKGIALQHVEEAQAAFARNKEEFRWARAGLDQQMAAQRAARDEAWDRVRAWMGTALDGMPVAGKRTFTDARGHFTVEVPRKGLVAVFASGTFNRDGKPGPVAWGVWVDLAGKGEATLRLDANNMLLVDSRESVLH